MPCWPGYGGDDDWGRERKVDQVEVPVMARRVCSKCVRHKAGAGGMLEAKKRRQSVV